MSLYFIQKVNILKGMIKMDQEKLTDVLKDKAFAEKIVKLQTSEEVQAAFKEKGIEISAEEVQLLGSVINKMVEKGSTELSEEDFESISGGSSSRQLFMTGLTLPFRAPLAIASPYVGSMSRSAAAGSLLSIAGIVVASHTVVPWAYKKVKGTINSYKNKK